MRTIEIGQVLPHFILLSGLSEEEALFWEPLCLACGAEICARVRAGVDQVEQGQRLGLAAAVLANYRYTQLQGGGESMRVGEFSYTQGESAHTDQIAWELVRDLLDNRGVQILGVAQ